MVDSFWYTPTFEFRATVQMPPGMPVLIMAGQNDFLAMPEESRAIAARIGPAARVVVIPGAGHTVLMGVQPKLVCAEIDGFLQQVRGGAQVATPASFTDGKLDESNK